MYNISKYLEGESNMNTGTTPVIQMCLVEGPPVMASNAMALGKTNRLIYLINRIMHT